MDKKEMVENTKSRRMVGCLAAAVALLAVAFVVLIVCAAYIIENQECDETAVTPVSSSESCDEFHYEGHLGNITYTEYTTVCKNAKTEFGIVRDKTTGFVMNTFFMDYKQPVSVVYLAKSHRCLLSNELDTTFEDDLASYRSNQYGQGPSPYSVGNEVDSWDEIPEDMRGFCSPRNTFRWLKHEPDTNDDHRSKRHGIHLCCCFIIFGPNIAYSWACDVTYDPCTFGSICGDLVAAGHWFQCPPTDPFSECLYIYQNG